MLLLQLAPFIVNSLRDFAVVAMGLSVLAGYNHVCRKASVSLPLFLKVEPEHPKPFVLLFASLPFIWAMLQCVFPLSYSSSFSRLSYLSTFARYKEKRAPVFCDYTQEGVDGIHFVNNPKGKVIFVVSFTNLLADPLFYCVTTA